MTGDVSNDAAVTSSTPRTTTPTLLQTSAYGEGIDEDSWKLMSSLGVRKSKFSALQKGFDTVNITPVDSGPTRARPTKSKTSQRKQTAAAGKKATTDLEDIDVDIITVDDNKSDSNKEPITKIVNGSRDSISNNNDIRNGKSPSASTNTKATVPFNKTTVDSNGHENKLPKQIAKPWDHDSPKPQLSSSIPRTAGVNNGVRPATTEKRPIGRPPKSEQTLHKAAPPKSDTPKQPHKPSDKQSYGNTTAKPATKAPAASTKETALKQPRPATAPTAKPEPKKESAKKTQLATSKANSTTSETVATAKETPREASTPDSVTSTVEAPKQMLDKPKKLPNKDENQKDEPASQPNTAASLAINSAQRGGDEESSKKLKEAMRKNKYKKVKSLKSAAQGPQPVTDTQNSSSDHQRATESEEDVRPAPSKEHKSYMDGLQIIRKNKYLCARPTATSEDEPHICNCKVVPGKPACGDDCVNRMMYVECEIGKCPCGDACTNNRFQKRQWAKIKVKKAGGKGFGLFAAEPLKKGQFIIEYVGEVVDDAMLVDRMASYGQQTNFYFLTLTHNQTIDATKKGNHARFMNHSCSPNCVSQKWSVGNEIRVGLFALRDIEVGEECTFDYDFERYGMKSTKCLCGAPNCRGIIGPKPKQKPSKKKDEQQKMEGQAEAARKRQLERTRVYIASTMAYIAKFKINNVVRKFSNVRIKHRGRRRGELQSEEGSGGGGVFLMRNIRDGHRLRILQELWIDSAARQDVEAEIEAQRDEFGLLPHERQMQEQKFQQLQNYLSRRSRGGASGQAPTPSTSSASFSSRAASAQLQKQLQAEQKSQSKEQLQKASQSNDAKAKAKRKADAPELDDGKRAEKRSRITEPKEAGNEKQAQKSKKPGGADAQPKKHKQEAEKTNSTNSGKSQETNIERPKKETCQEERTKDGGSKSQPEELTPEQRMACEEKIKLRRSRKRRPSTPISSETAGESGTDTPSAQPSAPEQPASASKADVHATSTSKQNNDNNSTNTATTNNNTVDEDIPDIPKEVLEECGIRSSRLRQAKAPTTVLQPQRAKRGRKRTIQDDPESPSNATNNTTASLTPTTAIETTPLLPAPQPDHEPATAPIRDENKEVNPEVMKAAVSEPPKETIETQQEKTNPIDSPAEQLQKQPKIRRLERDTQQSKESVSTVPQTDDKAQPPTSYNDSGSGETKSHPALEAAANQVHSPPNCSNTDKESSPSQATTAPSSTSPPVKEEQQPPPRPTLSSPVKEQQAKQTEQMATGGNLPAVAVNHSTPSSSPSKPAPAVSITAATPTVPSGRRPLRRNFGTISNNANQQPAAAEAIAQQQQQQQQQQQSLSTQIPATTTSTSTPARAQAMATLDNHSNSRIDYINGSNGIKSLIDYSDLEVVDLKKTTAPSNNNLSGSRKVIVITPKRRPIDRSVLNRNNNNNNNNSNSNSNSNSSNSNPKPTNPSKPLLSLSNYDSD